MLCSFPLSPTSPDGIPFALAQRLDLAVGDEGVIGRRVVLWEGQIVVGEGIIGWN